MQKEGVEFITNGANIGVTQCRRTRLIKTFDAIGTLLRQHQAA